jgi:hypothetical protein
MSKNEKNSPYDIIKNEKSISLKERILIKPIIYIIVSEWDIKCYAKEII